MTKNIAQLVQPEPWTPEDMAYRPGGLAQPDQEPVAKVVSSGEYDFPMLEWISANHSLDTKIGSLLYTSPPKLQPLTDEDIALIDWESIVTKRDCVRAIEAQQKAQS